MSDPISGVYSISFGDGQTYIGSSIDLVRRFKQHERDFARGNNLRLLQEAFDSNGKIDMAFLVVEYCSVNELYQREQHYMDKLSPSLNQFSRAQGPAEGVWRQRLSDSHKLRYENGAKNSMAGKKRPDIALLNKARVHSEDSKLETSKRNSFLFKGKRLTQAHKDKIGAKAKGRKFTEQQLSSMRKPKTEQHKAAMRAAWAKKRKSD